MFIALEGLDGSGKTTLTNALYLEFCKDGSYVYGTREPDIYRSILKTNAVKKSVYGNLFLFMADRADHVRLHIRPEIEAGHHVICDRYEASTFAYQCGGLGLNWKEVEYLNNIATDGIHPDLTIFLDITYEEAKRRMIARDRFADSFDLCTEEFFNNVRNAYREYFYNDSSVITIDANQPATNIFREAWSAIKSYV